MTKYQNLITREEIEALPFEQFKGEIVIVDSPEQVEEAVTYLSQFPLLGLDTETRPIFKKGEHHNTCLVQISTEERAYLFRIQKCTLHPRLIDLLENNQILKIGVSLGDDYRGLHRIGDFLPDHWLDLQKYVKAFGIEELSFAKLMAIIMGVRISKRQQTSNWEAEELSVAQQRYAATDAWGSLVMYLKLRNDK